MGEWWLRYIAPCLRRKPAPVVEWMAFDTEHWVIDGEEGEGLETLSWTDTGYDQLVVRRLT